MARIRNTLLITAILVFSAVVTVWGTRDAVAFTISVDLIAPPVPAKPTPTPDSGEPDTGSTKTHGLQKTSMQPGREGQQGGALQNERWVFWISRMWKARYLRTDF